MTMNTGFFLFLTAASFPGLVEEFSVPVDPKARILSVILSIGSMMDSLQIWQSTTSQLLVLVLLICPPAASNPRTIQACILQQLASITALTFPGLNQPIMGSTGYLLSLSSLSPLKTSSEHFSII
ncbi:hypothetical protein Ahia01_000151000 [Argonauta hians]